MKKLLIVGVVLYVLASLLLINWSYNHYGVPGLQSDTPSEPRTAPTASVPTPQPVFTQEPYLASILESFGVNDKSLNLAYSNDPMPAVEEEWASYQNRTILVRPDLTEAQTREMIGHEYMHHVWATKPVNRTDLQTELTTLQNNWLIADRLNTSRYNACDQSCKLNETQAYACTIINKNALPELVGRYCKTYLPSY